MTMILGKIMLSSMVIGIAAGMCYAPMANKTVKHVVKYTALVSFSVLVLSLLMFIWVM